MDSPSKIRTWAKACLLNYLDRAREHACRVHTDASVFSRNEDQWVLGLSASFRDFINSRTASIDENTLSLLRELQG
jgi:hypothetical protein